MVKRKHTHKYMRQQLSKFNKGWRCVLPGCDHILPKNIEETIVGRLSWCWECGEEFRLDETSVKDDQPKCSSCISGTKSNVPSLTDINMFLEMKTKIAQNSWKEKVAKTIREVDESEDKPEVTYTHSDDCEVYNSGVCTCGVE